MTVSKAQQKAVNKYISNNYDRISVTVPKGKRELIQSFALSQGLSTNAFINYAIDRAMDSDHKSEGLCPQNLAHNCRKIGGCAPKMRQEFFRFNFLTMICAYSFKLCLKIAFKVNESLVAFISNL